MMEHYSKKITLKKMNIYEFWVLLIAVIIMIELLVQPDVDSQKSTGGLFAFNILGFRALSSELLVYIFILFGGIALIAKKAILLKKIIFAPKIYSPLPGLIFLLILVSCIMGYSNRLFLKDIRAVLIPPLFFIVYINIGISYFWEKFIFYFIIIGITGLVLKHQIPYYNLPFALAGTGASSANISTISASILEIQNYRSLNLISILVFLIAVSRLLFSKFRFRWLLLILICSYNFFLFIGLKSTILPLFCSLILMFYFKIISKRFGLIKLLIAGLASIVLIYRLFMFLPEPIRDIVTMTVGTRYLKLDSDDVLSEVRSLPDTYRSKLTTAIFSNRPTVWKAHFKESLKGFGLAPQGFGFSGDTWELRKNPHNLVVFFATNSGIITALLILLLIVRYIQLNSKVLQKLNPGQYNLIKKDDLIGIFCFTFAILVASMWEGSIRKIHVAFLFWFCSAIVLRRWDLIKINGLRK